MKKTTIKERIAEIQNAEEKLVQNTRSKINYLKTKLEETSAQLEKTYASGDVVLGEKLVAEKSSLSSRIEYLEDFLKKRGGISLISDGEAAELKASLNDEMKRVFVADREKLSDLFKQIGAIAENGSSKMKEVQELGNAINELQRKNGAIFGIDGKIQNLYTAANGFAIRFMTSTLPLTEPSEKK